MARPIIRRIDHFIIRADGSRLDRALRFFRDDLGMLSAWPPSDHPAFRSAGIHAGNVDFEILAVKGGRPNAPALYGIVFELEDPFDRLQESLNMLEERGVPSLPVPYLRQDGTPKILWHNVFFGHMLGRTRWMNILFTLTRRIGHRRWMRLFDKGARNNPKASQWMFDHVYRNGILFAVKYNPEWRNVDSERTTYSDALALRPQSGVEIVRVRSVTVTLKQPGRQRVLWESLLKPHPKVDTNTWQVGDGPAVRLLNGEADAIRSLTFEVRSLALAKEVMSAKGINVKETSTDLRLDAGDAFGLDVRIVEV